MSTPKAPTIKQPEPIEEVQKIEDDASEEQKRERRRIALTGGRQSTVNAGIAQALKKRLGE